MFVLHEYIDWLLRHASAHSATSVFDTKRQNVNSTAAENARYSYALNGIPPETVVMT